MGYGQCTQMQRGALMKRTANRRWTSSSTRLQSRSFHREGLPLMTQHRGSPAACFAVQRTQCQTVAAWASAKRLAGECYIMTVGASITAGTTVPAITCGVSAAVYCQWMVTVQATAHLQHGVSGMWQPTDYVAGL